MKRQESSFYVAIGSSIIFLALFIINNICLPLLQTYKQESLIYPGIYINNVYVGNMNRLDACKILYEKFIIPLENKEIIFVHDNIRYIEKSDKFGICYDIVSAVDKAFSLRKTKGNIFEKTINRLKGRNSDISLGISIIYDESSIDNFINTLKNKIDSNPVNASVDFNGEEINIIKEVEGKKIDLEGLKNTIQNSIKKQDYVIEIPVNNIIPELTYDDLSKEYSKIASFSTPLISKNINRTNNIKIAASYVNGTIILPGAIFSANKSIGPRTIERGYKNAPIFSGGRVVPGLAGGICQLVTTLYNAALQSNMQIVERKRHGLPVHYVAKGMDATISGDSVDLKFKNTRKNPIAVQTYVDTDKVIVNLYEIHS